MKITLESIVIFGLASATAGANIECYDGESFTDGYNATNTVDTGTACYVTTEEGRVWSMRGTGPGHPSLKGEAGCIEDIEKTCDVHWKACTTKTKKTCTCKTKLCNNAPSNSATALVFIIAMAFIAKFTI